MRDCIFLVADKNMAATFDGFLGRDKFHLSLGSSPFRFDADRDLIVEPGSDPGVFTRAHELLASYKETHQFAVIALDCAWDGSPGQAEIIEGISSKMQAAGWAPDRFAVIAIEPEVDVWMWQDNPHVSDALRYREALSLRELLQTTGWWPHGEAKPPQPKEAMEWVLRRSKHPRSSAVYREIASKVSVRGCQDGAFQLLAETLRAWFPLEQP